MQTNTQLAGLEINQPEEFKKLSEEEQIAVCDWIHKNLVKIKSVNSRHSSYGLKHFFENDKANGGFYVTNGAFKGAMRECGFTEFDVHLVNWYYNLSEKSITKLRDRSVNE